MDMLLINPFSLFVLFDQDVFYFGRFSPPPSFHSSVFPRAIRAAKNSLHRGTL